MTVDAGHVSVRLGADFVPEDFERFDKAIARAEAKQKIEAQLGGAYDPASFTHYEKALDRAEQRASRRGAFKAALGGEFNPAAFRAFDRELQKAEREAQKGVTLKLDADAKPAERELFRIRERAAATRSEIAKGATFHVNTAVARAELDLLERKAHQAERAMAESRLAAAGFGDGGGGGGGLLTAIGGAAAAGGALTAGLAGASGIVAGLAGAATALAGSLAAAAAGAGALGAAAAGVALPAVGLLVAMASRLKDVMAAYKSQSTQAAGASNTAATAARQHTAALAQLRAAHVSLRDAQAAASTAERSYRQAVAQTRQEIQAAGRAEQAAARGVVAAQQAVGQARDQARKQIDQSVTAEKNAETAVVTAERNVTAARQAAQAQLTQAVSAERAASQQMVAANQAVTQARLDAARAARDANTAAIGSTIDVADAHLNVKDSHLAVSQAQLNLSTLQKSGTATTLQLQQAQEALAHAQLDVKRAQLNLTDATNRHTDALKTQQDFQSKGLKAYGPYVSALDAQKQAHDRLRQSIRAVGVLEQQGVQRNPRVVAAVRALAAAEERRTTALRAMHAVERRGIEGSNAVMAAEGRVARARQTLATAEQHYQSLRKQGIAGNPRDVAAADALRSAHWRVSDAMHQVAAAQKGLNSPAMTAGVDKTQSALAKLDRTERGFLGTIHQVADTFKNVMRPATDAVFSGMDRAIKALLPSFKLIGPAMAGLGKAVGGSFATIGRELANPAWTRFFGAMTHGAAVLVRDMTPGFMALARIFRDIATASLPYLEKGVRAVSGWLGKIAGEAGNAGRLHHIVDGLVGQFASWAKFGGAVAKLVGTIFMGGARQGKGLVDTLTRILDRWARFLNTPKGQADMRRFFRDAVGLTKLLGGSLGHILGLWGKVALASLHFINGLPGPLKSVLVPLAALGVTIGLLASKVLALKTGFVALRVAMKANPIIFIASAVLALGTALVVAYKHSQAFRRVVNGAFHIVERVVGGVLDKLTGGLTTLMGAASTVLHVLSHVPGMGWAGDLADKVDHLRNRLDRTRESMRGWGHDASSSFKQGIDGLDRFIGRLGVAQAKHISVGGTRDLPHGTLHRAVGGPIPGLGGGDVVPAMLEPGEHVLTKGEVRSAGGHGAIHALRRALGGGGQAAGSGYAQGGAVTAHLDVATGVEAEHKRAQRPLAGIRDDLASIARAATHAGTATHQVLGARLGDARKAVAAQTGRLRKTAGDDFEGVRKDAEAKTRRTHDDTDDRWTDLRKRLGHTTEKWRTDTLGVFDDVRKTAGKTTSRLADSVTGNLEDARKGAVRRVTQLRDTVTDRFDDARKNAGRKTKQLSDTVIGRLEDARRGGSRRAGQLSAAVVGSARDMERGTTRHLTAVRTVVADRMEGARRTGAMRGGQLRDAVAGSMGSLDTAVFRGMRYVGTATNEALKAFGAKPVQVSVDLPKKAGGGWIGRPGEQGGDHELALLGRGEAVVNRHQQTHIEQALGLARMMGATQYGSLDSLFGGVTTPHGYAAGGFVPGYAKGKPAGKPGGQMGAMIAQANEIERHHYNYEWGGGHNAAFQPTHGYGHGSGPGIGYDCSGAVSKVLHAGGLISSPAGSSGLMSYGQPGPGRVTVYADPIHTVMSLDGHFFGTSGSNPGGGAGWLSGLPRAFAAVRHVGASGSGTFSADGTVIPDIKSPKVRGSGPLATLARQALSSTVGAARKYVGSKMPKVAGSSGDPGQGGGEAFKGGGSGAVARALMRTAREMHSPAEATLALFEGGLVESGMRNLNYGDRDSRGVLQQRPSAGWGTVAQVTNPFYAARKFLERAIPLAGRYPTAGRLAQAVQGSAFPARYDAARGSAMDWIARLGGYGGITPGRARGGFADGLRRFASGGRAHGHRPGAHGHRPSGTGHHAASSAKNVISGRIGTALKGLGGDWGMSAVTDRLGVLDADYAREDRAYNVDVGVQDFVVPAVLDASGKVTSEAHLDARALGRKAQSLDRLVAIRRQMMGVIKDARAALGGTLATLKDAIGKLRAARAHAKSKDRSGYSRLMGRYVADIKGVQGARGELFTMSQDAGLDLREVKNERRALLPGAQSALDQATAAAGGGVDTGSAGDTGSVFGDTGSVAGDTGGSAAGSMADVAAQAQQMFATFTQSRQDLFSQFGSNFTGAGGPGVDPGTAAAGTRYWGAFGPGATGAAPPPDQSASAPSSGAQVTNYYAAPPPDPHTHSVQMLYELQALGG